MCLMALIMATVSSLWAPIPPMVRAIRAFRPFNGVFVKPLFIAAIILAVISLFSAICMISRIEMPEKLTIFGMLPKKEGSGSGSEVYRSSEKEFREKYMEMEKNLKIYIYPDGDENTYYQKPKSLSGKYASEGYFFQNIRHSSFRTHDPHRAHFFFIPISCHKMRGKGRSREKMIETVQEFVQNITLKYGYWNKTLGADHFFVTCHDIGVAATEGNSYLAKNSIRVVCSSGYDSGFIPHKDVSLPQVLQPFDCPRGGYGIRNRTILGFWSGNLDSDIRRRLVRLWGYDKELDIQKSDFDKDRKLSKCDQKFFRSKFCLSPPGSVMNSARITESIYYGCVPVILTKAFDLPFNKILNWEKFSVLLHEDDVVNLKSTLRAKAAADYHALYANLKKVQRHFVWNAPPVKYDAFHMVLYDLWLRRHDIIH